jgi:hypothetical protein
MLPILALIVRMGNEPWLQRGLDTFFELTGWYSDPNKLSYYICIRLLSALCKPFLRLFAAIVIKRWMLGPFKVHCDVRSRAISCDLVVTRGPIQAGPVDRTDWDTFRYWLMEKLLSSDKLAGRARRPRPRRFPT